MSKAVKIVSDLQQITDFANFLKAFDITFTAYKYNNLVYINIDSLLKLLNVDKTAFIKQIKPQTEYITIKKETHINKYGFTILFALIQNSEHSHALQDHIYKVVSLLECDNVNTTNIILKEELDILRSANQQNISLCSTLSDENKRLQIDFNYIETQYLKLKEENAELLSRLNTLEMENTTLKEAAKKLSKYIRIKTQKPKVLNELNTIEEECELNDGDNEYDDEDDETEKYELIKEAKEAKKQVQTICKPQKSQPKQLLSQTHINNANLTNSIKSTLTTLNAKYLLRSIYSVYDVDHIKYEWFIVDKLPELRITLDPSEPPLNYKQYSHEVMLTNQIQPSGPTLIWYKDLNINEYNEKIFHALQRYLPYMSEQFIIDIFELLES